MLKISELSVAVVKIVELLAVVAQLDRPLSWVTLEISAHPLSRIINTTKFVSYSCLCSQQRKRLDKKFS